MVPAPRQRPEDRVPDIFDEVEEDLRADRARALLARYGILIVAAALLVIAGVGGWEAWRWHQGQVNEKAADAYIAAMRQADSLPGGGRTQPDKRDAAERAFAGVAATAPEGYRTLARLRDAALKADGGNLTGAEDVWDQVSADGSADPLLRDLATLLWVQHQPETAEPTGLRARLQPLTAPENPWHGLALEQSALIDMRTGATDQARDTLRQLAADATAPEGVRGRAGGLLARLGG